MSSELNSCFEIVWNLDHIQDALGLSEDATKEFFRDGRRASFLLEYRIADQTGGLKTTGDKPFDIAGPNREKWEVRCLTKGGLNFAPSNMRGTGRAFDFDGFQDKLKLVNGFYICDIRDFPSVPVWRISSETVKSWYQEKVLQKDAQLSLGKADRILQR